MAPSKKHPHVDDYWPPPPPSPTPTRKTKKLEIFQVAPTIPEFRQLEKTRKNQEVFLSNH